MDSAALQHHAHKLRIELQSIAPVYRAGADDAPPAYTPHFAADDPIINDAGGQPDQGGEEGHGGGSDDEYCSEAEEEDDDDDCGDDDDEDHEADRGKDQSGWAGAAIAKAVRAIQQERDTGTMSLKQYPIDTNNKSVTNTITVSARTTIHGNNNTLTPDFSLIGARLAHVLVARLGEIMPASPLVAPAPPTPGLRRGSLHINVDCGVNITGNGNVVGLGRVPLATVATVVPGCPAATPAVIATNTTNITTMPGETTAPGSATKLPLADSCLHASKSESMPCSCQPAHPDLTAEAAAFGDISPHTSVPTSLEASCPDDTNIKAKACAAETSAGDSQMAVTRKRVREEEECDGCGGVDEKARRWRRCRRR